MKKNYFFGAMALMGMLSFASCSSDEDPVLGQEQNELLGEQVILLDMQDTDVLSTKSRPLYSAINKGAEEVTDVALYIFKEAASGKQELVKILHVPNWATTSSDYSYGRKHSFKLTGENKLVANETYTIYAVGQNETAGKPAPFKFDGNNAKAGFTVPGLAEIAVPSPAVTHNFATTPGNGFPYFLTQAVSYGAKGAFESRAVSEAFSGQSQPITFTGKDGFMATVLLKRQVAGVMGYFCNIPAEGKSSQASTNDCWSTKLRLVASNRNDRVDMTIKLDNQKDDATNVGQENIVNGFKSKALAYDAPFSGATTENAYVVYEIDLKKWYNFDAAKGWEGVAAQETAVAGAMTYLGLNGNAAGWNNPYVNTNSSMTVADGSVFGGEFVIPFDKVTGSQTFELQLIGEPKATTQGVTGEQILQKWAVKLDRASISPALGDDATCYNIYRNHLYQIGKRGKGDNPDKPGIDPDKPQPLDNTQELVIKINDEWEFIHNMEIE